jgi:two-component system, NtrC family, response regulator HydG
VEPRIAVLCRSDAFVAVWPDLAGAAGGRAELGTTVAELAPLAEAAAVVIAVAGVEEEALDALAEARQAGARAVAVVGAAGDHRLAVALGARGAADYFALPADLDALRGWVSERAERLRAARRADALAEAERASFDFSRLIGNSPQLRDALERAARMIRRSSATVLITGETGTGKELLAQAIHHNGPRAAAPFVEVNCTALPGTLLEAELFGYERGAFTDARVAKPGLFEAAHGGTLFLDELGDTAPEMQVKLLKVLEDKVVRRLGSVRSATVDVRIIAATHVDLPDAVAAGAFRQDLYYRLSVLTIHLPPLRERGSDILLLADHFLDRFADEHETRRPTLSDDARAALLSHSWPGNIRELRNAIERAVLLGGAVLDRDDVVPTVSPRPAPAAIPFPATMDEIEAGAARAMVELHGGNKSLAAAALGISRSRLYRLLGESG